MPDSAGAVREARRPPFCFQTLDATAAIRERFDGVRRGTAIAIYATLTEVANEIGGADARESFEATRKRIAEMVGISVDTLDRYVRILEQIGLIAVERRTAGSVNLPNVWHLCDPPGRTGAATPGRTGAALRARAALPEEVKARKERARTDQNTTTARPRDPIWDAFVLIFGASPEGRGERSRWNAAARDLREAHATGEEVVAAAAAYRAHPTFRDCVLTPHAISMNWTILTAQAKSAEDLRKVEIGRELAEWRAGQERLWGPRV
jgi:hypothetical protein